MTQRRRADPLPLGGDDGPYSKGLMARALVATGVPGVRAYDLAARVEADLRERRVQTIDLDRLQELAIEVLGEREAARAAKRLRWYRELRQLDLPVILLLGGATGTGK